jgi:hypothetical protein
MTYSAPLFLVAFATLAACGGSALKGPSDDGGVPEGASGDGSVPGPLACNEHISGTATGRPAATQCSPTTTVPPLPDGGVAHCATDADCASNAFDTWCHGGACEPDQCFGDSDCASGQTCACANEQIGNAVHTNRCVSTQCRVDTDCASGETCSRTGQDLCSAGAPFYVCRSAADTCRVDADCCPTAPACRYDGAVGHWACVAACTIAG